MPVVDVPAAPAAAAPGAAGPAAVDDRLRVADRALALSMAEPLAAIRLADDLLGMTPHDEAATVALRARALGRRRVGDVEAALADLLRAERQARRLGLPDRVVEARTSRLTLLADAGRSRSALRLADDLVATTAERTRARVLAQRGLVLQRAGRYGEAEVDYRSALPVLRATRDVEWEARVLSNRGPLLVYLGDVEGAIHDLRRCVDLADRHDLAGHRPLALGNLAFAYSRYGDAPTALRLLDEAVETLGSLGWDTTPGLVDKAETYLAVGLASEALGCAREALDAFVGNGVAVDAAEARLLVARAALAAGRPETARDEAAAAARELAAQRRTGWARLARHVATVARWRLGERTPELLAAARRSARDCAAAHWPVAATEALLVAGQCALALGRRAAARELLGAAAASRARGPTEQRAHGWHARALLHLDEGSTSAAMRAVRRGLDVVDDGAAVLGATDLRASAATLGRELADVGLSLVLARGRAREVFGWTERRRAVALRRPPARPPSDDRLAADLAALRGLAAAIRDVSLDDARTRTGEVAALQARREALERAVRERVRHASAEHGDGAAADLRDVPAALGDATMVAFLEHRAGLHAVVVAGRRATLHDLGPVAEVRAERDALLFALRRLAYPAVSERATAMALDGRRVAAGRLDALLLAPLRGRLGGGPLVVVPSAELFAVPWLSLPALRRRPVTVAPSAALWLRAVRHTAAPASAAGRPTVVAVAGPGLPEAPAEVADLHDLYAHRAGEAVAVLTGAGATAEAAMAAMDGARLVHVAAHGTFRPDNPLFSALELADGPLTVYDLERLRRSPGTVLLSACDSGLGGTAGLEIVGLAAALLGMGTRSLVASVGPVSDERTRVLMRALHEGLVGGRGVAAALAAAADRTGVDGFLCLGAG